MARGYMVDMAEGLVSTVVGAAVPVLVNDHTGTQGGRNALMAGGAVALLGALGWGGVLGRNRAVRTAGEGLLNGALAWGTVIGVTAADKAMAAAPKTGMVQARIAQVQAAQAQGRGNVVPFRRTTTSLDLSSGF